MVPEKRVAHSIYCGERKVLRSSKPSKKKNIVRETKKRKEINVRLAEKIGLQDPRTTGAIEKVCALFAIDLSMTP